MIDDQLCDGPPGFSHNPAGGLLHNIYDKQINSQFYNNSFTRRLYQADCR